MRFSLKWLLALMAYVALAAAAASQGSLSLADAVWTVTIVGICYALLVAATWDDRRGPALGFVVLAAANIVCLYLGPHRVPSSQFLAMAGYDVSPSGDIREPMQRSERIAGLPISWQSAQHLRPMMRTANAVGTLAAGLFGGVLGALAFRQPGKRS